jgi:hypothetical protein
LELDWLLGLDEGREETFVLEMWGEIEVDADVDIDIEEEVGVDIDCEVEVDADFEIDIDIEGEDGMEDVADLDGEDGMEADVNVEVEVGGDMREAGRWVRVIVSKEKMLDLLEELDAEFSAVSAAVLQEEVEL